ncbi:HlyD family secretion protein [Methylorubrum salsuginis]|uniref:Membrane fusion protein n=1 Tax=Methylorubrum salsuginis TaxID=414703 RepID=A0A1I3YAS6_9HYPH|nr:HlyD family efflux transporter periplasmic adaptor subunit [Methylorubrum salsuginis]SFK28371.1 membrane fusion protein [Methylorubrum salsuginis]
MTKPLFRREVAEARRSAWLGEAQIVQPLPVRIVVRLCLGFVAAVALYVWLGTYTRRVHADGLLAPDVGLITVASPLAGRVSASGVKEGERVERGQLLFTIDLDAVSASGPTQERVIAQLARQRDSVERQRAARAAMAEAEKRGLTEQIANLEEQGARVAEQVELQEKLVPPLKTRAQELADAVAKGFARAADFQSQNYLYLQATSQLAQFRQNGLQVAGKLGDLKAKLATYDETLARDLAELDRTAAQLEQQRAESEARRAIEVRAPERGILTSIRAQAGQTVAAGASLLTLLPSEGRLQANLYVDSSAIGFIEPGATVMLRYAAFPFQRFGLYGGRVTEVTRAPLEDGNAAPDAARDPSKKAGGGVYRIVVRPDADSVTAYGEKRRLEAGMRVEADIALEKRPLYRWLLDPITHVKRSVDLVTDGGIR